MSQSIGAKSSGAGEPAPLLEARGISVRFGGVQALDGVGLSTYPESITGLVGPNGAGKTTLFGVLSGLIRPGAGAVLLDGTSVTTASPARRARDGLSRTFQRPQLFSGLTVREHMKLGYRLGAGPLRFWRDAIGLGRRHRDAQEELRIDAVAAMLELTALLDTPVDGIGLGTARVVEVARALVARPRVLLLDEPSSGLDTGETERLAAVLTTVRDEEGVGLLLVEHDLEFVLGLSRAVYVLDFGHIIATGTPEAIRADPTVQAAYIGAPL